MYENMFRCQVVTDETRRANMTSSHFHPHYEIYYFLGDEMTFFLQDVSLTLIKHDFVLINQYIYHKTFYHEGKCGLHVNIAFDESLFTSLNIAQDEQKALLSLFTSTPQIRFLQASDTSFVSRLFSEALYNDVSPAMQKLIIAHFLNHVFHSQNKLQPYAPLQNASKRVLLISEVIAYLNQNFGHEITLDSLSKEFFISKFYLCRCFKEVAGTPIMSYLCEKRIHEADRLLCESKLPVSDICGSCGFDSMSNFLAQFKLRHGMSPRAFRQDNSKLR